MACNSCNNGTGGGSSQLNSSTDALRLPATLIKPANISEEMLEKAKAFNALSDVTRVKEHIVDGVNAVPPVLLPTGITLPVKKKLDKNDLPSLKEMAFGLTKEIKANLENAISHGILLVSAEEADKRFATCLGCEFLLVEQSRCLKCGCFMNMKTRLQASKCPVGKW